MPQLDKVTFLSQFFWLCFFYGVFYFTLLKYFLPKMSRILKLRKKKMSISQEGVFSMHQENEKLRNSCESIMNNGYNTSRNVLYANLQRTENWLNNVVVSTNQTHYQKANKAYIQSVGESCVSQNLTLSQISTPYPFKLFAFLVLSKIDTLNLKFNRAYSSQQKQPTTVSNNTKQPTTISNNSKQQIKTEKQKKKK